MFETEKIKKAMVNPTYQKPNTSTPRGVEVLIFIEYDVSRSAKEGAERIGIFQLCWPRVPFSPRKQGGSIAVYWFLIHEKPKYFHSGRFFI